MKQVLLVILLFGLLGGIAVPSWAQNPFTSRAETRQKSPEPVIKSVFLIKITIWQHHLRQKMSELIREARKGGKIGPLLLLMGLAFAYGAVHAAGPGHGKAVAVSYVLSHRSSVSRGLLFGFFIALVHGFSGVVGVIGLRYIIQSSVSGTLAMVTYITQIVSYSLIALLGLALLLKNGYSIFSGESSEGDFRPAEVSRKRLFPWAVAVGLVPCPAVVMVMLFCISVDVTILGFLLALCISLGMATTISCVVIAVIVGRSGVFKALPHKYVERGEQIVGVLSGTAIAAFSIVFLLAAVNAGCG